MSTQDRPSLDERMDQWLNEQADVTDIPDEDRQRFIDFMRGTTTFAVTQLAMASDDLWQDSGVPPFLRRLAALLERRLP